MGCGGGREPCEAFGGFFGPEFGWIGNGLGVEVFVRFKARIAGDWIVDGSCGCF